MSPSELIEAGERLFGPKWRQPLADLLGVNISTIRRWTSADVAIPRSIALAVTLLLEKPSKIAIKAWECKGARLPLLTIGEPGILPCRISDALTPKQIELLLWQIVMDFGGGEITTTPAQEKEGREVIVLLNSDGSVDLCANEDYTNDE